MGFAPRLTPENFKAAFTAAEGWGSFRQRRAVEEQTHELEIKRGSLKLKSLAVELAPNAKLKSVTAKLGGKTVPAEAEQTGARVVVTFGESLRLDQKAGLEVRCSIAA
jgi:hypothetical protein